MPPVAAHIIAYHRIFRHACRSGLFRLFRLFRLFDIGILLSVINITESYMSAVSHLIFVGIENHLSTILSVCRPENENMMVIIPDAFHIFIPCPTIRSLTLYLRIIRILTILSHRSHNTQRIVYCKSCIFVNSNSIKTGFFGIDTSSFTFT